MLEKKRVLVPVDGSAFSLQIFEPLRSLRPPQETELILLRVEPDVQGLVAGPAVPAATMDGGYSSMYTSHRDARLAHHPIYASQESESRTAAVRESLQKVMHTLQAQGYAAEIAVRFGDPAAEILNYLNTAHVDLLAMTTHGRTGLQRFLFGSVAAEILRSVSVPVLLVRPFAKG